MKNLDWHKLWTPFLQTWNLALKKKKSSVHTPLTKKLKKKKIEITLFSTHPYYPWFIPAYKHYGQCVTIPYKLEKTNASKACKLGKHGLALMDHGPTGSTKLKNLASHKACQSTHPMICCLICKYNGTLLMFFSGCGSCGGKVPLVQNWKEIFHYSTFIYCTQSLCKKYWRKFPRAGSAL